MSAHVVLTCDTEDTAGFCGARLHLAADNAAQARRSAEAAGWTHTGGKDHCRLHSRPRVPLRLELPGAASA